MTFLEVAIIIAEKEDRVSDISYLLMLVDRIKLWRNSIIRQTLKANPNDISYYLTEYKSDLIKVPSFESGYDVGCDVLRTKDKIHKSLRVNDYVYMVCNSDFTCSFGKANNDIGTSLTRKYSLNEPIYTIRNEYLYVYNTLEITQLGIMDCLEFPELIEMNENKGLSFENTTIKATDDVIQKVISAIWSEDLRIKDSTSEERLNNLKQ